MITEVLHFTSDYLTAPIYLEKYNRVENVLLNTILFNGKTCEDYINDLKNKYIHESEDFLLLVVKYIPPKERPNYIEPLI